MVRVVENYGQYKITIPKDLAEDKGWKSGTVLRFVEDMQGRVFIKVVRKSKNEKTKK